MIEWVSLSQGGTGDVGRSRDQHARHRFRQLQGRGRQRHPAAEGRPHRRACRRRRPHRLVPDRSRHVSHRSSCPTSMSSATPASPAQCRNPHPPRNAQGKVCAAAVVSAARGQSAGHAHADRRLLQPVAPDYAFSLSGVYRPKDGQFAEVEGGRTSPVDAPREIRAREADECGSLVQDHHGGSLWLGSVASSVTRMARCVAFALPGPRRRAGVARPMPSSATPFRNR